VTIIYVVVIMLLSRFSQQMVFEETLETTKQALVNTALRIDNTLRRADMTAQLEGKTYIVDKALITKLMKNNSYVITLHQHLPHAEFFVSDSGVPESKDNSYVFSEPINDGRYHLIIVCPAEDIRSKFKAAQTFVFFMGIFGLLMIVLCCWKVIVRHLWPLHLLADSAEKIASGNLEVRIPDSGMKNEIGQLQNSFATMQLALANYIDEMQQKQVMLGRQNTELEKAYSQTQEYEKLKMRFLNNMADQVFWPINSICRLTEQACDNYNALNEADMARIEAEIQKNTEVVTRLIEQLLNVPVQKNTMTE